MRYATILGLNNIGKYSQDQPTLSIQINNLNIIFKTLNFYLDRQAYLYRSDKSTPPPIFQRLSHLNAIIANEVKPCHFLVFHNYHENPSFWHKF